MNNSISFVIHDLNPWGGQDRSTMEIAKHVSRKIPIDVYAFTLDGFKDEEWGQVRFHKIRPNIPRPVLIKHNLFYALTVPLLLLKGEKIHATGTCSLMSDIVQVQFIQTSWNKIGGNLKDDEDFSLSSLLKGNIKETLRSVYHSGLTKYNIALESILYTKNKHYIAISNVVRQELIDCFQIPENNISVIHHGVDSNAFYPVEAKTESQQKRNEIRNELGFSKNDFVFVLVGALNRRKGVLEAIEAFAKLSAEHQQTAGLIIAGNGPRAQFDRLILERGLHERIHIISHKKNVTPYYWASDAFVLPSHYEPFGLVVLEAMACGLPTIVSQSAGGSELIENFKSGLLIEDPGNIDQIKGHMQWVLENPKLAQQISAEARIIAENNSWEKVADKYLKVIQQV